MTTTTTFKDSVPRERIEQETAIPGDGQHRTANHRQAAFHLEQAVKNNHEAIEFHDAGNREQAFKSTVLAYGHYKLAGDYLEKDIKQQVINK